MAPTTRAHPLWAGLLWDWSPLNYVNELRGCAVTLGSAHALPNHSTPHLNNFIFLGALDYLPKATAPQSQRFGPWPPLWYLDAVNRGHSLVRDGIEQADFLSGLVALISGRSSGLHGLRQSHPSGPCS